MKKIYDIVLKPFVVGALFVGVMLLMVAAIYYLMLNYTLYFFGGLLLFLVYGVGKIFLLK